MYSNIALAFFSRSSLVGSSSLRNVRPALNLFFIPRRGMSCKVQPMFYTGAQFKGMAFSSLTTGTNGVVSLVRQCSSKTARRKPFAQNSWRILRGLFIVTGVVFWSCVTVIILARMADIISIESERPLSDHEKTMAQRVHSFFQVERKTDEYGVLSEEGMMEINAKGNAAKDVFDKLRSEDAFLSKFGMPVYIGNKIHTQVGNAEQIPISYDLTQTENVWKASFFVDGPKNTGVASVEFHKVETGWIPVSLQLTAFASENQEVMCDISAPLPNGLTRFSHLLNRY